MKKLLTALTIFGLVATTTVTVVACGPVDKRINFNMYLTSDLGSKSLNIKLPTNPDEQNFINPEATYNDMLSIEGESDWESPIKEWIFDKWSVIDEQDSVKLIFIEWIKNSVSFKGIDGINETNKDEPLGSSLENDGTNHGKFDMVIKKSDSSTNGFSIDKDITIHFIIDLTTIENSVK